MKTLTVGTPAPAFSLLDQDGNTVSLADFSGKKVLFYFYPKAMTPGCTVQAQGLRDVKLELDAHNVVILGVSVDPVKRLGKFIERDNLNFTLLSDEDHAVAEQFGVWGEKCFTLRNFLRQKTLMFFYDKSIFDMWVTYRGLFCDRNA
ncbi:thioredoxin-dependent thiol peroxidase [Vibrio sp. SA48]